MRKGFWLCGMVLGVALGAAIAAAPVAVEEQGFTPIPVIKGIKSLEVGVEAPAFRVKDLGGKSFDFAEERTKRAHVLIFWSIFCEPCREEMPVIEKLFNEYKAEGKVTLVTVNMDGEPFLDAINGFLRQYAEFLGLVPDQVLKTYQTEADAPLQRPVLNFPMPRPEDRTPRLWLVVGALVSAVAAYALWYRHQESLRLGQDLIKAVPAQLADLVPGRALPAASGRGWCARKARPRHPR